MKKNRLKFVLALARTHNSIFDAIGRDIQGYGFTVSEFGVLEFLYHTGEQSVQKIAEKILVTSGTITYVIDKLQKQGLVLRKQCETDKRVYFVALTPEGEETISRIFPLHEAFLNELLSGVDEELIKAGLNDLIKINNALNRKDQV